jgi:hypothetical protein
MTKKVESLGKARAAQLGSSMAWEPIELLDHVSQQIKDGEIKPTRLMVVYIQDGGGRWDFSWRVAKCTFESAVYMLNLALHHIVSNVGDYDDD